MTTNWTLTRIVDPAALPVTIAEAKSHLRLSQSATELDDNLQLIIEAATERVEQDLDRQIISATYQQSQFCWVDRETGWDAVRLHKKGVTSITEVAYYNTDGDLTVMDAADYIFDEGRGAVFPASGTEWPSVLADHPAAVSIKFAAGYGADGATVPRLIKQAILLSLGKWFYDPGQEGSALHSQEIAYQSVVQLIGRPVY